MSVILNWILDFIYPKSCVICGKDGVFLCEICLGGLERVRQTCPVCGRDSLGGFTHPRCRRPLSLDGLTAVYSYKDPSVRKVIEAIKFGFNKELVKVMLTGFGLDHHFDLIVPVPLHRLRLNWRGFNQAEEIAKRLAGPVGNLLVRKRNTKQQALIKNRKERKENVRGAFEISTSPPARKILLVDDVFTTGESMKECCKVLKRAGPKNVWGFVLAR